MNKFALLYLALFPTFLFFLTSCSTQSSLHGLWHDTNDAGTIEFKNNGEVVITDNASATVTGDFILENDTITFELTASDILQQSIQPISKTTVKAKIIKLDNDQLQLEFIGHTEIESYKRAN